MTRRLRLCVWLGLAQFVVCLLAARPSFATSAHGKRVTLTIAGSAGETKAFELVATELLARLSVRLNVQRVPRFDVRQIVREDRSADSHLARVWLDFSNPARPTLYIHDLARDRLLVREVEAHDGGAEIAREELGHILQTSIEGLLAGAEIGVPRRQALPSSASESSPGPSRDASGKAGKSRRTTKPRCSPSRC